MCICVFRRYELKYVLTPAQYEAVLARAAARLRPDEYGRTAIQSLYYDTDDFRLIRRSIEKPEYKEKLRLRSYGLAEADDKVFLELKKKCSGVVYKRRIETTPRALANGETNGGQIGREIDYFEKFYGDLSPKALLIYDREAYFGEGDLRVTFDHNVRYRTEELTLGTGLYGTPLFSRGEVLMEIKTGAAIPLWLTKILSEERIYKTSFSKYGTAYEREAEKKLLEVKKVG